MDDMIYMVGTCCGRHDSCGGRHHVVDDMLWKTCCGRHDIYILWGRVVDDMIYVVGDILWTA